MAELYDVSKLKTPDECRTVMDRAKEQGLDDVYVLVFKRYCELYGIQNEDPADPLARDFYETLGAYEQLLTEKHGKKTSASYTRRKIKNKGIYQSLIEWTRDKVETDGFNLLIDKGFPEFTGEYLVVKYSARFPDDVVDMARERLIKHNVALPLS